MSLEDLLAQAEEWRRRDPDPVTAAELGELIERRDAHQLADRFAGRLEFGTAGLRGILGAGPNRMNRAVVRQTGLGLARYLLAQIADVKSRGVVVARDARRMSRELAEDTAGVLAAQGIPTHVFSDAVPTPLAAYATLQLRAAAAVVVTASHNPPEYNGYKVYWGNGAQIVPPHDRRIVDQIEGVGAADTVPLLSPSESHERGLLRPIDPALERAYLEAILAEQRHPGKGPELRIVYTAMHGVGGQWVLRALGAAGFVHVHPVPEQQQPDGEFPTVRFPNPEEPGALDLSLALAEKVGADLILANDPDADRLAVVAREASGKLRQLTGNEVGVLLGHYALTETRPLPSRPLVMATIVSSAQLGQIAGEQGARYEETLTGFRWICNRALELESDEEARFLFGYEEALGYTVGTAVRDKDGVGAALVFADLAGWCRSRGATVPEHLEQIQRRHGLFLARQVSFRFPGIEGPATISRVMQGFRERPPGHVGERAVRLTKDYLEGVARSAGHEQRLALPSSNVIAFDLGDGDRVTLRPSGTEPKIKYYFELRERPGAGESVEAARARGEQRLERLIDSFLELARERGQPA